MCSFVLCVCLCVYGCILASATRSVKDILAPCLRSLWSQGAVDCPTGRQEEGTQLPHLYTRNTHCIETITHTHSLTPVMDRSGTQIRQREPPPLAPSKTLAHTHARTRRASQRAACQEGEHGREHGKGAGTALELCHSHSVNVGAREQSRKQAWTNLLNLACCSA